MFREKIYKVIKTREGKIIAAICGLSIVCYMASGAEPGVSDDGKIIRDNYGGGTKIVTFTAQTDDGDKEIISISVKSRQYTDEECEELYTEAYETICNTLLGGNDSLNNVQEDLYFFKTLNGYPFSFAWRVRDRRIFDEDGKLIAHEDGSSIIYMTVTCNEWVRDETFELNYIAAKKDTAEEILEDLKIAVEETEKESRSDEYLNLPPEIDGKKISYSGYGTERNPAIFLLSLAAIVTVLYGARNDKRKQEIRKKEMIIEEYPIVLQKMIMYLSAGMNLRNVWIRIYEDSVVQKRKNPIYAEMGITVNELKNGVSETTAYKGFSKRTKIPEITRFTTLLTQNLKKGSTNLCVLLSEESEEAFENRKRRARIKGEEAGTKLLVPMVLLMIVIMVIIMLPAFWNM